MSQGPILIFDKSTLESLNVDEAALLDNFYVSNVTPLFFVECLADLEKQILRSKSTPEQLVGSIANRTPDSQSCANVYHRRILEAELTRQFDLSQVLQRPVRGGSQPVQLDNSKGIIFHMTQEEEALHRWAKHDFLDIERQLAKGWRRTVSQIDLDAMSENVLRQLGHWRKPRSLEDARHLVDTIIDSMDPEWILHLGLEILGYPHAIDRVVLDWTNSRRKPLREWLPYFTFVFSINIFFCLILPTELLRKVKQSHHIDLAYLYYLPFCSVFTSRDNFHVQVAPLFMTNGQEFVHGDELKADLHKLDEYYSKLTEETLDQGLCNFAQVPPDDSSFLTTRLWDKFLPAWRSSPENKVDLDPQLQKVLTDMVNRMNEESKPRHDGDDDIANMGFVTIKRQVQTKKGKYLRFSKEAILKDRQAEMQKRK